MSAEVIPNLGFFPSVGLMFCITWAENLILGFGGPIKSYVTPIDTFVCKANSNQIFLNKE